MTVVDPSLTAPYQAEWDDLVRLHRFVVQRKVTTILEFGVGSQRRSWRTH